MDLSDREAPRKIAVVLFNTTLRRRLINNAGAGFGGRFDILDEAQDDSGNPYAEAARRTGDKKLRGW
jgi:hypothetical protein